MVFNKGVFNKAVRLMLLAIALSGVSACGSTAEDNQDDFTQNISGALLYNRCKACHSIGKGERSIIGPNLWGIVGRDIAATNGFQYSKALSSKDGIWDETSLNAFLKSPQGFAPGTRMSFSGIRKASERKALIEYLTLQSD